MSNIYDVAKLAGVSIATVSNVFNDSPKVKDHTKAKVLRAASELHYSGMGKAENLNPRGGKTIGIVSEDLTVFNTPEILDAICRKVIALGWETLICNLGMVKGSGTYDFDETECTSVAKNAVRLLLSKGVDGIIYVGCQSREIKHLSAGFDTPFVYAYCYSRENDAPSIIYDDENISYELTRFLIQKGHTNIGIITGVEDNPHVRARLLGFQKAHYDSEVLYNPNNIVHGDLNDSDSGFHCMPALLENQVTAVFCMNDIIAVGVYDFAISHDIRIPKQLAVVGFDNQAISSVLNPRLTTVSLPLCEIGAEAVEQMEKLLSDKNYRCIPNIISLNSSIVIRDSV